MKKFLAFLGIIFLIAAGGVGGFFIGSNYEDTSTITTNYVKSKIDLICESAGWTSSAQSFSISPMSAEYGNYTSDEVDYNGYEDFAQAFILFAKYAFDQNGVKPNTFILSESSYTRGTFTYDGKMGMYYTLENNVANIWLYDFNSDATVIIKLDNNVQYKNEGMIEIYSFSTWRLQDGISYAEIHANIEKVTRFCYSEIVSDETNLSKFNALNITELNLYDCDTRIGKKLSANIEDFSNQEIESCVDNIVKSFDGVFRVSFDSANFTSSNALEDMYKALGYK